MVSAMAETLPGETLEGITYVVDSTAGMAGYNSD